LRPGAWFGETALIDDAPRRATVTSRTPVTVLVFGKREFAGLRVVSRDIGERLDLTTSKVVAGEPPTELAWYQPLSERHSSVAGSAASTLEAR